MDIDELGILAKETRILIDDINHLALALEGQGCTVEFQLTEPYNKIDFLIIKKTFKL